jgi:hypothetical protein
MAARTESASCTVPLAVPDVLEQVGADVIDERDARVEQQLRAHVRVAPADAHRGVDHRGDLVLDERLRADPVQVGVVDDGDVAGAQPLGEVLGALVHPRRRRDAGQADGPVPAEPGKLAEGSCHR